MNKFEEYKSFEEKSDHFSGDQDMLCGNIEYLFTTLEELDTSGSYLFRGVNNAKFKLYNSAQREFINREISAISTIKSNEETYPLWIKELISEIKHWNKESVSRFFESIGIHKDDDIAYLSLMQHLGYPTPLLDFTLNPFTALFFATENISNPGSTISIESCISLYALNKLEEINKVFSIRKGSDLDNNTSHDKFLEKHMIAIIDHYADEYKVKNNMNILNQQGCFVYNWHWLNPLEVSYEMIINQINNSGAFKILGHQVDNKKMRCFNIHKALVPKIRLELDRRFGINKNFIYPELSNFKTEIIDKSISNITI